MNLNSIVLKHFFKNKSLIFSIVLNLIAYVYLDIIFPKNSSQFIDQIDNLNKENITKTLFPLLFSQLCFYVSDKIYSGSVVTFEDDIINEIFTNILKSKETNINKLDVINNLTKVFEIKNILHLLVAYFFPTIMVSIALLFYFFTIDKTLGITYFSLVLVALIIMKVMIKKSVIISEERDQKNLEYVNEIDDILLNINKINHNNMNEKETESINIFKQKIRNSYVESHDYNGKIKGMVALISIVILLVLSSMLIGLYKRGKITKGNLITYMYMVLLLLQYYDITSYEIDTLLYYVGNYEQAKKYFERFETKDEIYMENSNVTGSIKIENMSIEMKGKTILNNISMYIPPNKKTAIIGDIGTGKSSLLKGIMKIYPYTGNVLIDNVNVNSINTNKVISYIPQSIHYFNRTIFENLTYGNQKSCEQVNDYIKYYGLEKFVEGFSNGLDTKVIKHGENISGGQKQILELLKVLLDDKKIILMDEPTASLSKNFKTLFIQIISRIKNKTIVVITHDDEILPYFDNIIKID